MAQKPHLITPPVPVQGGVEMGNGKSVLIWIYKHKVQKGNEFNYCCYDQSVYIWCHNLCLL